MLKALSKRNGYCQSSKRLPQLEKLCFKLNIPFQTPPKPLSLNSDWSLAFALWAKVAGFFDGDGTIHYSLKNGWPQLTISVSNKKAEDCEPFQIFFKGIIPLDKDQVLINGKSQKKQIFYFFASL